MYVGLCVCVCVREKKSAGRDLISDKTKYMHSED